MTTFDLFYNNQMEWLYYLLNFTIYGYSIPQILGVLLIVAIAVGVVIYFSTIWSVTRTKNVGKVITPIKSDDKLRYSGLSGISPSTQPIRFDVYIDRNRIHKKEEMEHFDQNSVIVLEAQYSYEIMVHHFLKFQTSDSNGKTRLYHLENITDEKIFTEGNTTVIQIKAEYICDASFVEGITNVHYDTIIEYSINKTDENDQIRYLNQIYMDELTNVYLSIDSSDLKSDHNLINIELDTLPQEFDKFRKEMPSLIDDQPCIRSLLFLLCYKILDPGFRSIGLEAIQKFVVLMTMHVEMIRLTFLSKKDANERELDLNYFSNIRKILTVEEMIRRFVCKYVTNIKRRADILEIMNQYSRIIINSDQERKTNPNLSNSEVDFSEDLEYQELIKITSIIDTDLATISLSTKMYSEIMVSLADPDSALYSEQISRLYTMLCPLYNILSETSLFDSMDNADSANDKVQNTIFPIYLNNIKAYLLQNTQNKQSQSQSQPDEEITFLDALHYTDYSDDTIILQSESGQDEKESLNNLLESIIDLTWKVYGFNPRLINAENKNTYLLMK